MPAGNEVIGGSGDGLTPPSATEKPDCMGEELMSWEGLVLCVPRRPTARSKRLAVLLFLLMPCVTMAGGARRTSTHPPCTSVSDLGWWKVTSEAGGLLGGRGCQVKDRESLPGHTRYG